MDKQEDDFVYVNTRAIGFLLGKGGSDLKKMCEESGAKIQVDRYVYCMDVLSPGAIISPVHISHIYRWPQPLNWKQAQSRSKFV